MDPHAVHPESLAGFPVVVALPVQWGDQDAFQHVNNTVYLRWFESARIEYFGRIGLLESQSTARIGPILASIRCDYRIPVTYPDHVKVGARVVRIGRSSLTFENRVAVLSSGVIAADGTATIVVFNYEHNRSHPVPDRVRNAIESLEGRSFLSEGGAQTLA